MESLEGRARQSALRATLQRKVLKTHQRLLEVLHFRFPFALRNPVALLLQALRLSSHAPRELFIQAAVVSNHSPIWGDLLLPVAQVFLRRFGSNADENPGRQRTSDVDVVVPRKSGADLRNRYQLSSFCFSNQSINIQRLWNEHHSISESLGHRSRDFDDL